MAVTVPPPVDLVEVLQPHVDYLGDTPQVAIAYMSLWKVAKLPAGAEVRVTCISTPAWCGIGASPSPVAP